LSEIDFAGADLLDLLTMSELPRAQPREHRCGRGGSGPYWPGS
jgi:hypothetical protein